MNVVLLQKFVKEVEASPLNKVRQAVMEAIENVEAAKSPSEIVGLRKLSGYTIAYRIRIGKYRIGVYIEGDTVTFIKFADRKEIYNKFP